jgi:DNA-directed RNA polymerase sigma subunit (sigma70/sigma32)
MTIKMPNGEVMEKSIEYGDIQKIDLEEGKVAHIEGRVSAPFSLSTKEGNDRRFEIEVEGGVVGVLIDARGRPVDLPTDDEARRIKLKEWLRNLDAYPAKVLEDMK